MRFLFLSCLFLSPYFIQAQTFISRQNAFNDIEHFQNTIEAVHYNPYYHIKKQEYRRKVDSIKATIPDSIEFKGLVRKFYAIASLLDDAHTGPAFIQPSIRSEYQKKMFFPVPVVSDENNLVFAATTSAPILPAGSRLLNINGKDVTPFSKEIESFYGGEAPYSKELSHALFASHLYMADIKPPFTIRYETGGKVHEKKLDSGLKYRDVLSFTFPYITGKPYQFSIINGNAGYLDFQSMSGSWQDLSQLLDTAFRNMRASGIHQLVIDLRKNTGGSSILGEVLLSYITNKKYSLSGGKNWKISQQYKDYLLSQRDSSSDYLKKSVGSVWSIGACKPRSPRFKNDTLFNGKVYFLTGPLTFSSANMVADAVKQYKLGTIVGEPTGERTNDFGELYSFRLPNSGILMNVTTSYDLGADCNKWGKQVVTPDVLIRPTVKDRTLGKDPVLEYILNTKE